MAAVSTSMWHFFKISTAVQKHHKCIYNKIRNYNKWFAAWFAVDIKATLSKSHSDTLGSKFKDGGVAFTGDAFDRGGSAEFSHYNKHKCDDRGDGVSVPCFQLWWGGTRTSCCVHTRTRTPRPPWPRTQCHPQRVAEGSPLGPGECRRGRAAHDTPLFALAVTDSPRCYRHHPHHPPPSRNNTGWPSQRVKLIRKTFAVRLILRPRTDSSSSSLGSEFSFPDHRRHHRTRSQQQVNTHHTL